MSPPISPKNGADKNKVGTNVSTKLFIKFAPAEIPTIPGSAKGFFMTACKSTPDVANIAPVSTDTNIRGNLTALIISTWLLFPLISPSTISAGANFMNSLVLTFDKPLNYFFKGEINATNSHT